MEDMERILTQRWELARQEAIEALVEADKHLGWVGTIYSGQLSLNLLEDDIKEPEPTWGVGYPD